MNKKIKKVLILFLCFILVVSISGGILVGTRLLYEKNHKTAEEIMAEKNEIILGEESVFYVDLTRRPDDYEKIAKIKEKEPTVEESQEANEEIADQNGMEQINENYYDVEININSGIATVDGNDIKITDLLNLSEEQENQLVSSPDDLVQYLNDNVIGDLEYVDGNIKIENPYSTKTIMMESDNLSQIENCGEVESIVKVADNIYSVHYANAKDTKDGYNILKENDLVEKVCKDAKVTILEQDEESEPEVIVEALEAHEEKYAWGVGTTGLRRYVNKINYGNNSSTQVKVGVFDTGVRITHEVFENETTSDRIDTSNSYNYVDNNNNIADDNGHGTMVAGIVAESTSNNIKIVPVKVLNSEGKGNYITAMEGLAALADKVDVLNLSLGISEAELTVEARDIGEQILKPIYDSGKTVVCASGNDGKEDVYYPASSQYTIAVSAVDYEKNMSTFSNYGSTIDFSAPGEGLILPYYTGDNLYNCDFEETSEEYGMNSGTSFASPFVAAAIALLKTENSNATVEQLKEILKENCDDLGEAGKDKYFGYGSINFDRNMFSKPVIASVKTTDQWAKENDIEIYAVCGNPISAWGYTISEEPPAADDWKAFNTQSTIVKVTLTTQENGEYYIWFKDTKDNITKQKVNVTKVDITPPTIKENLEQKAFTGLSIDVSVLVQDTESGLAKINWYYKSEDDADYNVKTDDYTLSSDGTGETKEVEKVHSFSLKPDKKNFIYAEIYDVVGNFVKTKTIEIQGFSPPTPIEPNGTENTNTENTNTSNTNTENTNTSNTNTENTNTSNTNTENTNTNNTNTENTNTSNTNTENTNTGNTNTENTNTSNTNTENTNTSNTNTENTNTSNTNTENTNTSNTNTENTNTSNTNTENTNNTNTENTNVNNTNTENTNKNDTNTGNVSIGNETKGNSTGGGNSNKGNSSVNSTKPKLDNSMASNKLPHTGNNKIIILLCIVIAVSGIFTFVKYRKLKDIK